MKQKLNIRNIFYTLLSTFALITFVTIGYFYLNQEKLIFIKEPLSRDFQFNCDETSKELFFKIDKHTELNALFFQIENSKGVVLYFHGRGVNLSSNWKKYGY